MEFQREKRWITENRILGYPNLEFRFQEFKKGMAACDQWCFKYDVGRSKDFAFFYINKYC